MTNPPASPREDVEDAIATNRAWFMAIGIFLLALGIAAIIFPLASTIAAKSLLGWIFLIGGSGQIIQAFSTQTWSQFFLNLIVGILYFIAGVWLAFLPLTGIVSLTVFIAIIFLIEGVLEVVMGFQMRPKQGWGWMLGSGIIAAVLGFMILNGLPSTATWAIGTMAGVNLISSGAAYLSIGAGAKRVIGASSEVKE